MKPTILDTCGRILAERSAEYPSFRKEAAKVCGAFNALYPDAALTHEQYTLLLVLMKLGRETSRHKRDNIVDAINYLSFLDLPAGS